jgi:NAD(P)-dependent dehydrogenase (short-subunit alcohol dehydrogenase family)
MHKGGKAMFRTDLFAGKRFLISGGGTGLGRIMLERFVELGADCVICGRRGSVLDETARQVMARNPGRRVDTFPVDIRVASAVEEMIDRIWATGPLDGLVNNAAGNFISQTKDLSPRAFDAIANIVLHGTFYMTNACGKRWIAEQRKASVISILTTWVWTGSPFVVPSAMSKAGVAVMTQSLAVEWGRHGIRLNAIAPGPFPTEGAWARLNPMKEADDDRYKARNPMGRVGRPKELANMAAFLMSDEVEYINGEVIAIDGGMGIMGNGTFANMMAYSEDDWRRIRERIQSTNTADKAQRS